MKREWLKQLRPSLTLSASALTQLLAAFACFLAKFVLPATFVEFQGIERNLLLVLGAGMLTLGLSNLFYGRHFAKLLSRMGKRSRVVIPREGIGYLAIMLTLAVGALLGQANMPLLVFGMMAGPFILNGAIVYNMLYGINVTRRVPQSAISGDFVTVELEVTNSKRMLASHMLEVSDQIESLSGKRTVRDEAGTVTFVRIPAGQSRTGRFQVAFHQRGRYSIGPLRVSSRFPLGIGERGQLFPVKSEITVHPRLGQLLPAWTRRQKELAESSMRAQSQIGVFDDEFHRIREFRTGDNPRSIHWRSTARKGELMVREFEQLRHSDSVVILDLPEQDDWDVADSEMAVSLAATICVTQTRSSSGSRFVLAIAAKLPQIIAARSPGGFREASLDALATCQRSSKADLTQLLINLLAEHPLQNERLIVITPRPDYATESLTAVNSKTESASLDLLANTTIVSATKVELAAVFRLNDSRSQHNAQFFVPKNEITSSSNAASPAEVTV